jgi:hypothetical protein
MHLTRSSTRVHAAPGGQSSIVFGDYVEPKKTVVAEKENVRQSLCLFVCFCDPMC